MNFGMSADFLSIDLSFDGFSSEANQLLNLSLIEETFHHPIVDRCLFQFFGISELHNDPIPL